MSVPRSEDGAFSSYEIDIHELYPSWLPISFALSLQGLNDPPEESLWRVIEKLSHVRSSTAGTVSVLHRVKDKLVINRSRLGLSDPRYLGPVVGTVHDHVVVTTCLAEIPL